MSNKMKLYGLVVAMRSIAYPIGPLHSYWDIISDVESFLVGRETILKKTEEGWIEYCEEVLRKDKHE
jgi:hypothetical protein